MERLGLVETAHCVLRPAGGTAAVLLPADGAGGGVDGTLVGQAVEVQAIAAGADEVSIYQADPVFTVCRPSPVPPPRPAD